MNGRGVTHASLSRRRRRQMLMAVCLTRVPSVRLLTTIPSTNGIATDILHTVTHTFSILCHTTPPRRVLTVTTII
jgi:hypothetical protein